MKPGDRIGIVGPNGAGKTTLIKTILGLERARRRRGRGRRRTRGPRTSSRAARELRDELTVLEEVGDGYDYVELPDGKVHVRGFLRMLAFPDSVADTKVGQLSGGERNRVQLARLLRRGGNLLVLDEPTNDLDLPTLGALEDGLVHFPGCALIVSHDRWFLDRVATAILAFEGDGQVTLYEGSYSFYAERRPKPGAAGGARAGAARGKPERERDTRAPKPPAPRKLTLQGGARARGDRGRDHRRRGARRDARGDALRSDRVQGSRRPRSRRWSPISTPRAPRSSGCSRAGRSSTRCRARRR